MKTDTFFYQLFRLDPSLLFTLMGEPPPGRYLFESVVIKSTEKRLDGLMISSDGAPNLFLEIQGYNDPRIYWRALREVSTWYESSATNDPCWIVVLFLTRQHDPGPPSWRCVRPSRLVRLYLQPALRRRREHLGALAVLAPLVWSRRDTLAKQVPIWKNELETLPLPGERREALLHLLEYAILSRFPDLTLKEVQKMLNLTPLEDTVAGRELIEIGIERGIETGELIGAILSAEELLGLPRSARASLRTLSDDQLRQRLAEIKARARS